MIESGMRSSAGIEQTPIFAAEVSFSQRGQGGFRFPPLDLPAPSISPLKRVLRPDGRYEGLRGNGFVFLAKNPQEGNSPGGPEGQCPPSFIRNLFPGRSGGSEPSENPRVVWRAAALHVQSSPATCAAGAGRFRRNRFLARFTTGDCAAGSSKSCQGVAVAGERFSPVHPARQRRPYFFCCSLTASAIPPMYLPM